MSNDREITLEFLHRELGEVARRFGVQKLAAFGSVSRLAEVEATK